MFGRLPVSDVLATRSVRQELHGVFVGLHDGLTEVGVYSSKEAVGLK